MPQATGPVHGEQERYERRQMDRAVAKSSEAGVPLLQDGNH